MEHEIGKKAHETARLILRDNSQAQELTDSVFSFYGDKLELFLDTNFPTSEFNVHLTSNSSHLVNVNIKLQTGTTRIQEALSHELLHLLLLTEGLPTITAYKSTENATEADRAIIEIAIKMMDLLTNVFQHQLMIRPFTSLGFEKERFIIPDNDDYEILKNLQIPYIFCCFSLVKEFLSDGIKSKQDQQKNISTLLSYGKTKFMQFEKFNTTLQKKIQAGSFLDRKQYRRNLLWFLGETCPNVEVQFSTMQNKDKQFALLSEWMPARV